jgi:transcriptional regulator with XRE-family HTH domain
MPLGQRIRELRDKKDLSLREFAAKIDFYAAIVSEIELGRRYPSDKVLADMARILGVTVDDLKAHDIRPPVEEMKERIAVNPRYAFAFRQVLDHNITPEELIELAKRKAKKKSR